MQYNIIQHTKRDPKVIRHQLGLSLQDSISKKFVRMSIIEAN